MATELPPQRQSGLPLLLLLLCLVLVVCFCLCLFVFVFVFAFAFAALTRDAEACAPSTHRNTTQSSTVRGDRKKQAAVASMPQIPLFVRDGRREPHKNELLFAEQ